MADVRCRTVWISDVHLGTRECAADTLLAFLDRHQCDYLYLVGDIVDFWQLRRTPYWPQIQTDVVRTILSKARAGTIVTLIPGNHDEYLRRFCDLQLGNIMITREAIHRTVRSRGQARHRGARRRPRNDGATRSGSIMSVVALAIAAILLAPERVCYIAIARTPDAFLRLCARRCWTRGGGPTAVVERLFYVFKTLQLAVFIAWCYVHGGAFPRPVLDNPFVIALATVLVIPGQILVVATFYRLGRIGVFFGDQLGYVVRRCHEFPFSRLSHPQYVGTMLTIWGGFLLVRFPHDDWYALPMLETIYYLAGMWLEVPGRRYRTRYASITFKIRSLASRLTEGSERSRPT